MFESIATRVVEPWAVVIQSNALEPWALAASRRKHERAMQQQSAAVFWFRAFLRILFLLRQHAPLADVLSLCRAAFFASPRNFFPRSAEGSDCCWGRAMPTFVVAVAGFLAADGPRFRGVALQVMVPAEEERQMCLGAHCVCAFLAGRDQWIRRGRWAKNPNAVSATVLGPRARKLAQA